MDPLRINNNFFVKYKNIWVRLKAQNVFASSSSSNKVFSIIALWIAHSRATPNTPATNLFPCDFFPFKFDFFFVIDLLWRAGVFPTVKSLITHSRATSNPDFLEIWMSFWSTRRYNRVCYWIFVFFIYFLKNLSVAWTNFFLMFGNIWLDLRCCVDHWCRFARVIFLIFFTFDL